MKKKLASSLLFTLLVSADATMARADEITDWTRNLYESTFTANLSAIVAGRAAAIVQSAVFDAVNGIERRYTSIHVEPNAPAGASRRAAAVQAAYVALVGLFPSQQTALNAKRDASLAEIASDHASENSVSINRGIEWGQEVAQAILAWRSTDGFSSALPPFLGGNNVYQWRPTPPGFLAGAGVQFATMTPWVIQSPSQFRAPSPPALISAQYLADFNEVKLMGRSDSIARTTDQTNYARFWAASTQLTSGTAPHFNWRKKRT